MYNLLFKFNYLRVLTVENNFIFCLILHISSSGSSKSSISGCSNKEISILET